MNRSAPGVPISPPMRLRVGLATVLTLAALALFVMPRYGSVLPDPGGTLLGVLPAGPTAHVVIAALLAFVWAWALPRTGLWKLLAAGIVLSGIAETLQALPFVDRGARLSDFGLNALGAGLGLAIAALVRRVRAGRTPSAR